MLLVTISLCMCFMFQPRAMNSEASQSSNWGCDGGLPARPKSCGDPDNTYLWRMNSRRMEAEVVRDNLLFISGEMDPAFGGPDIDHM